MPRRSFFIFFGVILFAVALVRFVDGMHADSLLGFFLFLALAAFTAVIVPPITRRSLATVLGFLLILLGIYGLLPGESFFGAGIPGTVTALNFALGLWAFANAFLRSRPETGPTGNDMVR